MSIRYNLNVLSKRKNFSVYDLAKEGLIGASTANSLYQQQPVMTGTLLRLLEFADCRLEDFLSYRPENSPADREVNRLDLNGMVQRGIISRTAKRQFLAGRPMSLSTLILMAEDQNTDLMNFLRVETVDVPDNAGNLKKSRKVLYLSEW